MASNSMRGKPCSKSWKLQQLYKLPFAFSNHILYIHHVSHNIFAPTIEKSFIFCMFWLCGHVVLPHVVVRFYNRAFEPPNMLLKANKLGTKRFSPFDMCANPTPNYVHFLIRTNHNIHSWKFCYADILKDPINLLFPHPFFLLCWVKSRWWV
jgi:hypothetical protein